MSELHDVHVEIVVECAAFESLPMQMSVCVFPSVYQMQKIMYNNYREPKGSFTHSLKDTDIHLAATLHPVKNASFQYRLHKYFLMRDSLHLLRNRLSQLHRQLNDVASALKVT